MITGANGNLGRALAQRFAGEGEQVVLLGRPLAKAQEVASTIGASAMAVACKVTSPDPVRATMPRWFGPPPDDVLIINAAVFDPFLIEECTRRTDPKWASGPACRADAVFAFSNPVAEFGRLIINVSSRSVDLPLPRLLVHQSTKAGLDQSPKGLHLERGPHVSAGAYRSVGEISAPGK